MTIRRLRPTIAKQPGASAPEGRRAAYWREQFMGLSRPALAEHLGLTHQTIARYEAMTEVPTQYRLACAAIGGSLQFDWGDVQVEVERSTVTVRTSR